MRKELGFSLCNFARCNVFLYVICTWLAIEYAMVVYFSVEAHVIRHGDTNADVVAFAYRGFLYRRQREFAD